MEEKYYITCQTTRILTETSDFDGFKLALDNHYGVFNKDDIVTIRTLLEAYNDLYEKCILGKE